MFNDDETSPYYRWYISYENELSLSGKLDLIKNYGLGGIIVWESSEDTHDHKLIKQMGDFLKK
jgi:GH18 family chitinase